MKITVNGQSRQVDESLNLRDIITEFARQSNRVVVEVNGAIVPNEKWDALAIAEGDRIELVSFVGGG